MNRWMNGGLVLIMITGLATGCGSEGDPEEHVSRETKQEVSENAVTTEPIEDANSQETNREDSEEETQPIEEMEPPSSEEVQQYVANLVNDLTVLENAAKEVRSIALNTSIYGEVASGGKEKLKTEAENEIELILRATTDVESLEVPMPTDYYLLEPEIDRFMKEYARIAEEMASYTNDVASTSMLEKAEEINQLNKEIMEIEESLGNIIGASNYGEYEAIVQVWRSGESYHQSLAPGIKNGLLDYDLNFIQDVNP